MLKITCHIGANQRYPISQITILCHCLMTRPGRDAIPTCPGGSNDSRLHAQRKIIHLANQKSTHPSRTNVKSIKVFMELIQSCAATLTHYSTDRQGTPVRSDSITSLAKVPATCVQDARNGYNQDVLVFETLRIIVEPMTVSVPHADGTTATRTFSTA